MAILEVQGVSKSFPGVKALQDVFFELEQGQVLSILGPSGCGKTTLLRVIAGLEIPDAGQVVFAGQDLAEIPPHQRNFGLMFQEYVLFPHLDVFSNVAFGLRMQNLGEEKTRARVGEVLALVGLTGYEGRDVNQLSGGEQQRVALARTLAPRPRLVMLDEPLGSLDRALRENLMEEIPRILKEVGATAIYVTHDQEEAFALGHRVLIMDKGGVVQIGTPQEIYNHPANAFVARFLGMTNLLPARVEKSAGRISLQTPLGPMRVDKPGQKYQVGDELLLLIPPDAATLLDPAETGDQNLISGQVMEHSFRGESTRLMISTPQGIELSFTLSPDQSYPGPGEKIHLKINSHRLLLLPREANKAL